jgi:predicted metal-dependent HD superfamily phosphohydrolase
VLHRFLDAERIYATPTMHEREARARANLTAELRSLEP